VKTDAERSARYDAKTNAATVGLIVAAVLPDARSNFADPQGMSDMVSKEQQVQGILNGLTPAVPSIFYPFYYAYAREVWAATRKGLAGPALTNIAQGIRDKWNYKGFLTAATLDKISLDVFSIVTA
jgi:hypothetical protein